MNIKQDLQGSILFQVLIFGGIAFIFIGGLLAWGSGNIRFANYFHQRELATNVAEAGIEYYRWHLAHDPNDFQDATGLPGPYIHEYVDARGDRIGEFSLEIIPPDPGFNTVIIRSTGTIDSSPKTPVTIEVTLGQPSLGSYAVVGNTDLYFAENTDVTGKVHANGGIRFDGFAHNLVTSALSQYTDTSHSGSPELAVHTHNAPLDPPPPANAPDRPDVFSGGRTFPVPAFDFDGITADLSTIKTNAVASGVYLPSSGTLGYHLILKTDGSIDVFKVTGLVIPSSVDCIDIIGQSGWGTWSIQNESFDQNIALPANGAVFVEDNVWIDGQIDTARLTIAAARFPENPATYANVIINNNLRYTNYDGSDIIGIIAQNNVTIGMVSADDLFIDAALVAKNGRVGRYYYTSVYCSPYDTRATFTLSGLIASNGVYGIRYTDNNGYQSRTIAYDSNLLYFSPPFFPAIDSSYEVLKWREIR